MTMSMNPKSFENEVQAFCRLWNVAEFSLFGSVLREDFSPASDIDVLIEFRPEVRYSVWDLAVMQDQLETLFGRHVDLVEKAALKNPFRRSAIMRTRKVIYVS
jgi:uncharacterized protein